jgi:WXG100 family type VII secretion target
MANIKVTPDLLKGEATRLGQYIASHEENIRNITILVDNLKNEWTGEAQDAFYNQFHAQEAVFRNFRDMLEKFKTLMNTTAATMEQTDQGLQAQIRSF